MSRITVEPITAYRVGDRTYLDERQARDAAEVANFEADIKEMMSHAYSEGHIPQDHYPSVERALRFLLQRHYIRPPPPPPEPAPKS